eukprot:Colp12_sorted_trinity150504_noHs@5439
MIPFVDFFNTDVPKRINTDCRMKDDGTMFECWTLKSVSKGSELLVSYGPYHKKPNSRLLVDYGFVLPFSLHDIAVIPPPVWPKTDKLRKKRKELLRDTSSTGKQLFNIGLDSGVDEELIRLARVMCASEQSLKKKARARIVEKLNKDKALSDGEEKCAMDLIAEHLHKTLKGYSTVAMADWKHLQSLEGATLDASMLNRKNILKLRLGEKAALYDALTGPGSTLKLLTAPPPT